MAPIAEAPKTEIRRLRRRVDKLSSLLDVAKGMTAERDLNQLLGLILREAQQTVEADRCSLFIIDRERQELWSKIAQGLEIKEIRIPIGVGVAGYVAGTGKVVNIADAYDNPHFDKSWDIKTSYRTKAMLCVPMLNTRGEVSGVLQAINKLPSGTFSEEDQELLTALGSQAAAAIENALLNDDIDRLFEGFVKASVVAIESRDPTTSGHSERVAVLTLGIAEALEREQTGVYGGIRFSGEELKEIRYASLLHDFGKVGVREHVLVKANKLLPLELDIVQWRFAYIRRSLELDAMKRKFALLESRGATAVTSLEAIDLELKSRLAELDDFARFVETCNRPTVLAEGSFERLGELGKRAFESPAGALAPYLTDNEIAFLSVRRGSLTEAERLEIESHVVHTYRFLSQIPWTKELRRVPTIAYAHHEKLDGAGYPRRLSDPEIPVQSRMMTVSDIYDALTASDRPYKRAVPHDKALDILHDESRQGKIDPELLRIFIAAKVHEKLAQVEVRHVTSRLLNTGTDTAQTRTLAPVAAAEPISKTVRKAAKVPPDKPAPKRSKSSTRA